MPDVRRARRPPGAVPAVPPAAPSRRHFLQAGAAALAACCLPACSLFDDREELNPHRLGRLAARPAPPSQAVTPGVHPLGLSTGRDGTLYVPAGYRPDQPASLVLLFHGAGGSAASIAPLAAQLHEAGLAVVVPDSNGATWDVIQGRYGPDVAFVDLALAHVFARVAVSPTRLAIAGFSDGATYALSLGLVNGDLFTHVIAFSPGFVVSSTGIGDPALFIAHGTQDTVLPIDLTSRPLAAQLRNWGYEVHVREFDGAHTVPPEVAREAIDWFTA